LEETSNAHKCIAVDQDAAENRLLGFGVMRRQAFIGH
jgi:hypothetical protein